MAGNNDWNWITATGMTNGLGRFSSHLCDITIGRCHSMRDLCHSSPDRQLEFRPFGSERNMEDIDFITKIMMQLVAGLR